MQIFAENLRQKLKEIFSLYTKLKRQYVFVRIPYKKRKKMKQIITQNNYASKARFTKGKK